ncbi:hypothetical protein EMIT0P100_270009 [Pseudomonas sp. IT-P100]
MRALKLHENESAEYEHCHSYLMEKLEFYLLDDA